MTNHNLRKMVKQMKERDEIAEAGTVWLKMDGCAKQYKCGKHFYLMCTLAADKELGFTLDQMSEVTGHGKDEADGHGGVFKNWLISKMHASDLAEGDVEAADVVDGETASFAEACVRVARETMEELKPQAMNSKRRSRSNLVQRIFETYTEADISDPPEIEPIGPALMKDTPVGMDPNMRKMCMGVLGHYNYRADPELQKPGRNRVIAVRRLACACDACKAQLMKPITQRYKAYDTCAYHGVFERWNDWKTIELKPTTEDAAREMEEDEDLQLQARLSPCMWEEGPVRACVAGGGTPPPLLCTGANGRHRRQDGAGRLHRYGELGGGLLYPEGGERTVRTHRGHDAR